MINSFDVSVLWFINNVWYKCKTHFIFPSKIFRDFFRWQNEFNKSSAIFFAPSPLLRKCMPGMKVSLILCFLHPARDKKQDTFAP